jgi:hypothetical protein
MFFITFSFNANFFRLYFFAECHIPLNIVENRAFVEMMLIACPSFKVPTRTNLRDGIIQEAQEVKKMVSHFEVNEQTLPSHFSLFCLDPADNQDICVSFLLCRSLEVESSSM